MVKAQSYKIVGSARSGPAPNVYYVTEEIPGKSQTGAVWANKQLKLNESFELEFTVNFSANPNGADGVVVVMQTIGTNALAGPGAGIGFRGMKPSFGIEFDTHYNSETGDPATPFFDHIAVVRNGINDHRLNPLSAAPVPISTTSKSIKDGQEHLIKLVWNTTTHVLQVYVDCVSRVSQSVDLVNDIFGGTQEVYWGITSSTGSAGNAHQVKLPNDVLSRDTLQMCPKDTATLKAGLAIDSKYEWKPSIGLSNARIRNPLLTATTTQLYTVSYLDRCSVPKIDSVFVNVNAPRLSLGENRTVCENGVVVLTPTLTPANTAAKFRWSTNDTTRQLKPTRSGTYILQVTVGTCSVSDTTDVTFQPLPKLGLPNEPTYNCPRESPVLLDPQATGTDLQFAWTPGGTTAPTLVTSIPGRYTTKISTAFGCSVEQRFTILDDCPPPASIYVPDAFTPNGDGKNDVFEWKSSAEVDTRINIYSPWGEIIFSSANPGEFWNGAWKGQPCPPGVYAWRIDYRSRRNNENQWFIKRGAVVLLK
ncbi:lectin-like domain-containing protein [Spirosoma areae]